MSAVDGGWQYIPAMIVLTLVLATARVRTSQPVPIAST
jgi:hypothetical protein